MSHTYRGVDRAVLRKSYKKRPKQGRNTEKSTKYAIRSLNNGDFSREMAQIRGGPVPPCSYTTVVIH